MLICIQVTGGLSRTSMLYHREGNPIGILTQLGCILTRSFLTNNYLSNKSVNFWKFEGLDANLV